MIDNYGIWLAHDLANERWRESRPVCAVCKEHIQDEYLFNTERGLMCEDCADAYADELAEEYKKDLMDGWRERAERYET